MTDGTNQSFAIHNVSGSGWTDAVIGTVTGLSNSMLDMRLYIDTTANTLAVTVDGADEGTFSYLERTVTTADPFATILGGSMELDNIRVESVEEVIPEPATMLLLGGGLLGLMGLRRRKK